MTTLRTHLHRFLPLYALATAAAGTLAFARFVVAPETFDWPSWVQAVGSIAAILVAVWVSSDQAAQQRARDEERERGEIRGILRSLRSELETTFTYIQAIIAPRVDETEPGEAIYYSFPLPEYPFPIFDGLIPKLGMISDARLHNQIIHTFALAKSLAMTVTQHNCLLDAVSEASVRRRSQGQSGGGLEIARAMSNLRDYSESLRNALAMTRSELVALLETLTSAEAN